MKGRKWALMVARPTFKSLSLLGTISHTPGQAPGRVDQHKTKQILWVGFCFVCLIDLIWSVFIFGLVLLREGKRPNMKLDSREVVRLWEEWGEGK